MLNDNYLTWIKFYYWGKKININYYKTFIIIIKNYILKNLKKKIYYYNNNKFFFSLYIYYILKKKENFLNLGKTQYFKILKGFLKNLNTNFKLLDFKNFFQYLDFCKKFNKYLFRFNKERLLNFLQKKNLAMIGPSIYKNLKKKWYYSFFSKFKTNNNVLYVRNFIKFNNLIKNLNFKKKKKVMIYNKVKKKKIRYRRIIKKLKTFVYDSDRGNTKKQAYTLFKRSVFRKFYRKRKKKKNFRFLGLRFSPSIYKYRNRFKRKKKKIH